FTATKGKHPLFAPVDGANCPDIADNSDPASHSALLNNGLIRVGITLPQNAEFNLTVVRNPYDCAITTDTKTGAGGLCLSTTIAGRKPALPQHRDVGRA